MIYYLYLKSHCEIPDLEDEVEAQTKQEAVDYFMSKLSKYGWDKDMIEENVVAEEPYGINVDHELAGGLTEPSY